MVSRHHTLLTYATIHVCAAITSFYFWWQGEHQWTLVQLTCRYTMVHVHLSQSIIMYNVCKKNNKKAGIHQNQLTQTFHQNHNHVQSYSLNMISHFQKKTATCAKADTLHEYPHQTVVCVYTWLPGRDHTYWHPIAKPLFWIYLEWRERIMIGAYSYINVIITH